MTLTWLSVFGAPLLARIFLVILFPFSTLDKILNYKNALNQANSCILPGGKYMLVAGGLIEVVGSLCVVFAWHDRLAALILAGYCIATAFLFHQFWNRGDFWSRGDSQGRMHFWDFLKNFGLAGGLGLLVLLSQLHPASIMFTDPLSSAPLSATKE